MGDSGLLISFVSQSASQVKWFQEQIYLIDISFVPTLSLIISKDRKSGSLLSFGWFRVEGHYTKNIASYSEEGSANLRSTDTIKPNN